jgi:hypothetical protein
VAVKRALNLVLCALIVVVLQPGMADVAAYGRELLAGGADADRVARLFPAGGVVDRAHPGHRPGRVRTAGRLWRVRPISVKPG